jgi:hypothetical protein
MTAEFARLWAGSVLRTGSSGASGKPGLSLGRPMSLLSAADPVPELQDFVGKIISQTKPCLSALRVYLC